MSKIGYAWTIKYENEDCYSFAGNSFTTKLNMASRYETKEQAERVIKYYDLADCKPVKVKIEIAGDVGE